jgi:DNA-binding NarL/FixJ family response regulator
MTEVTESVAKLPTQGSESVPVIVTLDPIHLSRITDDGVHHLVEKRVSKQERVVINEVVAGLSNKEIAKNLHVVEKTIKFHLTNIYKKLALRSRSQLINYIAKYMRAGTDGHLYDGDNVVRLVRKADPLIPN